MYDFWMGLSTAGRIFLAWGLICGICALAFCFLCSNAQFDNPKKFGKNDDTQ